MPSREGLTLLHPSMFKHFMEMDIDFLDFLDRALQGAAYTTDTVVITSDFRTAEQQANLASWGGAKKSLHEIGRAVDLRMPRDASGKIDKLRVGLLIDSICLYRRGLQTEFEVDISPNNAHLHIGQWATKGPLLMITTCNHKEAEIEQLDSSSVRT